MRVATRKKALRILRSMEGVFHRRYLETLLIVHLAVTLRDAKEIVDEFIGVDGGKPQ